MSRFTLMVQGTTSDAGKSLVVAGLCRVLARRGINVAPFKPQNMALNSAVSAEGGEIGRAQALQAVAAGLRPSIDMNPILIKPESDQRAQIIVQGKVLQGMDAQGYHDYKARAMDFVLESYDRLREQHDVIVVEGAGSPAEINLRENDIANMGFAEAVDCPVLLVADIDRGGVFATVVGTLDLLSESERSRVCGVVINKFRGDIKLLLSGLDWLEEKINKPVLGVLPYLRGLYLDAEDALNAEQILDRDSENLKVSVIVLPHISNHTDLDPLRLHSKVNLQYVNIDQALPESDLVILPGTKNVREDLEILVSQGLDKDIQKHLRYGGKLLGICGGLQMLGKKIDDPLGIESPDRGNSEGLGYLEFTTSLAPNKQLVECSGRLLLDNVETTSISGYEIHCGVSEGPAFSRPLMKIDGERNEGVISEDGQIIGTYLHGLFDDKEASASLLNWAGLKNSSAINTEEQRDQQLDRLANEIIKHIDLSTLFPEHFSGQQKRTQWNV